MKNDMKLIMESWRNLQEQEDEQLDNIKTVGQAKKFIKMYRLKKAGKGTMKTAGRVAVDSAVDELAGKIPGLKTAINIFKGAKTAKEMYFQLYGADDKFQNMAGLEKFNVDDNVSKIVDNTIESAFFNDYLVKLDKMEDDEEIPDVTEALKDFLKFKFERNSVEQT